MVFGIPSLPRQVLVIAYHIGMHKLSGIVPGAQCCYCPLDITSFFYIETATSGKNSGGNVPRMFKLSTPLISS